MRKIAYQKIGFLVIGLLAFYLGFDREAIAATKSEIVKLASVDYDAAATKLREVLLKFEGLCRQNSDTQCKKWITEFKGHLAGNDLVMRELVLELKMSPSNRDKLDVFLGRVQEAKTRMQGTLQSMHILTESEKSKRAEYLTMFEGFDQKANQLFNILSTVQKQVKESEGSITNNIL